MEQVGQVVGLGRRLMAMYVNALLYLCGLRVADVSFPARTAGRPWAVDLVVRLVRMALKMGSVVVYPHILLRNVAMAVVLQTGLQTVGLAWRLFRRKLGSQTASGLLAERARVRMRKAGCWAEFRAAQKEHEKLLEAKAGAMSGEEQRISEQLEGKVRRYRKFVRVKDERRLCFELRSDLLRKHFGHDQHHPQVRRSIQRYVSIVCAAFHLVVTGDTPKTLHGLVWEADDATDGEDARAAASLESFFAASPAKASSHPQAQELPPRPPSPSERAAAEQAAEQAQARQRAAEEQRLTTVEKLDLAQSRLEFFVETRHSFGRSALLLSGGARMGFYHLGVIKTLMEHNLLPRVISGSSAGSIIAAVLGCKTEDEVERLLFDPSSMNLRFFGRSDSIDVGLEAMLHGSDPPEYLKQSLLKAFLAEEEEAGGGGPGSALLGVLLMLLPPPFPSYIMILRKLLPRWMESKVLLDIDVLKTAIRNMIGDCTFAEAHQISGLSINIPVTPHGGDRDVPNLLNYLTAPNVTVWSAACASCCIPGVFAPVTLMIKNLDGNLERYDPAGLSWIDGSLESDLPMQRLSELYNVNHFIVSQVNPHGAILAPHESNDLEDLPAWDRAVLGNVGKAVRFCRDQGRSYIKHVSSLGLKLKLPFIGPLVHSLIPVLVQKYSGDVTLYPKIRAKDLLTLLQNPTEKDYLEAIHGGELMVWPKLQSLRRRCMVEFMLQDCCVAMQARIRHLEEVLAHEHQLQQQQQQQQQQQRTDDGHLGVRNGRNGNGNGNRNGNGQGNGHGHGNGVGHGNGNGQPLRVVTGRKMSLNPTSPRSRGGMSRISSYSVLANVEPRSAAGGSAAATSSAGRSPMSGFSSPASSSESDRDGDADVANGHTQSRNARRPSANRLGMQSKSPSSKLLESQLLGRIKSVHQFDTLNECNHEDEKEHNRDHEQDAGDHQAMLDGVKEEGSFMEGDEGDEGVESDFGNDDQDLNQDQDQDQDAHVKTPVMKGAEEGLDVSFIDEDTILD